MNVKVIEVKAPPILGKVEMMQGIGSKEAAQTWGGKRGYPTVYWLKKSERVYAERESRVDMQGKQPEQQSDVLVEAAS